MLFDLRSHATLMCNRIKADLDQKVAQLPSKDKIPVVLLANIRYALRLQFYLFLVLLPFHDINAPNMQCNLDEADGLINSTQTGWMSTVKTADLVAGSRPQPRRTLELMRQ